MFDATRDQADGLRRIFHPAAPSLIPLGCSGPAADCRRYAGVVVDRFERIGSTPALLDRLDEPDELVRLGDYAGHGRVLLLDEPVRLARWIDGRQQRLLLLLSYRREALPAQYAMIKSIALDGRIRRFGTFFVDAPDARDADEAQQRLASCAARFLNVELGPVNRVAGSLAAMTDASLAKLQDYAIPLDPGMLRPAVPAAPGEAMH